jgi:hypothetical protein
VGVEAAAVSVSTDVLAVEAGLNEAVAPAGSPDALRPTEPLKPLAGVTVTVAVVLLPCAAVTDDGEADKAKSAAPVTVSVTLVERTFEPLAAVLVPVTVSVYVPSAAEPVFTVRVELVAVLVGDKDAVAPVGTPEMARLTVSAKPPVAATVIVLVPFCPSATLNAAGEAESE